MMMAMTESRIRGGPAHRARTVVAMTMAVLVPSLAVAACGSSPTRNAETFCTSYISVAHQATSLSDPTEMSTTALRGQIVRIDDAATKAARVAPRDVAGTVETVIEPLHQLRKDLEKAKSRTATNRALRRYSRAAEALHARSAVLDTWVARHCGVVPDTTTTTLLPPSGSTTG